MKRFNLVSMVAVLVLLVAGVSCTTMTGTQDDYYSQQPARRVYVEDPYRGTIVLERDPYSGRYYEVNSYGSYGRDPYYNSRVYRGNGRYRGNAYPDNRYRNNNTTRNNYPNRNQQPATQQPSPEQKEAQKRINEQNRQDARKKVLGN